MMVRNPYAGALAGHSNYAEGATPNPQPTATTPATAASSGPSNTVDGASRSSNVQGTPQQYCCLYTKHKTQKRKVWQDGRLVVHHQGHRATLYAAQPTPGSADPVLDECDFGPASSTLQRLETEKYLIDIEGPWVPPSTTTVTAIPPTTASASMQKVLHRKFQRPTRYIPPPSNQRPHKLQVRLGHRKRPLQPGELERMHYGGSSSGNASTSEHPPPASTTSAQHGALPSSGILNLQQQVHCNLQTASHNEYHQPPVTGGFTQNTYDMREQGTRPQDDGDLRRRVEDTSMQGFASNFSKSSTITTTPGITSSSQSHGHRNPRRNGLQFVSNEFNASGYDGFEEEEESEEYTPVDDRQSIHGRKKHNNNAAVTSQNCHNDDADPTEVPDVFHFTSISHPDGHGNTRPDPSTNLLGSEDNSWDGMHTRITQSKFCRQEEEDPSAEPDSFSLSNIAGVGDMASNHHQYGSTAKTVRPRTTHEVMALFGAMAEDEDNANLEKENQENSSPQSTKSSHASEQQKPGGDRKPVEDSSEFKVRFYLPSPTSSGTSDDDGF